MADKKTTLSESEITTQSRISRRAALARVAVVAAGVGILTSGCGTGCTDGDTGSAADPAGYGRHCHSGCTDSDTGASADTAGRGRHC